MGKRAKDGPGFIYLLERCSRYEVTLMFAVHVWNMEKAENELHELFSDSRFKDITKVKPPGDFSASQVKIGLSYDPKERVETINKSKLKDGKTEYFSANWLEVLTIKLWMIIIFLRPYIKLIFALAAIIVFLIYR